MRKYCFPLIIVLFFACNQEPQVNPPIIPSQIEQSFEKNFKGMTNKEWSKDGDFYEVEFEANGIEKSVTYNSKGQVVEIEIAVNSKDLPATAVAYLENTYPNYSMEEVERIENAQGIFFEVEIKEANGDMDVLFDLHGQFIKEEVETLSVED